MAAPTPVLTVPSGAVAISFNPAGTWSGDKLSKLLFQVRKASATNWDNPLIKRTRYPGGITGNQNWSISLTASDRSRLKRSTTYQARVKVWNKAGVASAWSSVKSFTISAANPTITLDALTEESDGHTALEGLVLTGTLGAPAGLEPASIKLEVFEAASGALKFSQMHAVTTDEAEVGEWSLPYIGPDLRSRDFAPDDPLVVLGTQGYTRSGDTQALTIPVGTKAIVAVSLSDGAIGSFALGGLALSRTTVSDVMDKYPIFWRVDITDRTNDVLTNAGGKDGNVVRVVYIGGNDVELIGHDRTAPLLNSPANWTRTYTQTKGGNVVAIATGVTHNLFGSDVNMTDLGMTVLLDAAVGAYPGVSGYIVGEMGASATARFAFTGGTPNNTNNRGAFLGLGGNPEFDGLYDIVVTIYDSAGGSATFTGSDYMHIFRALRDNESTVNLTTGLSNVRPTQRILVRDMGAKRGPGKVIGIIEDARSIGVSRYATSPGEMYFTLQAQHPQVSIIEPFATHYEYQQYRRGRWVSLEYGLFVDFDATEDEVVFYGMDYLGLLSVSIEGAHQVAKSPNKQISTKDSVLSGSRYKKKTIKYIIKNQLQRAKNQETHSPVKFINIGTLDKMGTQVTIFASHVERLAFIRGLIESHKGGQQNGQERRTRLRVRYRPPKKDFAFELLDNKGSNKDALRLEFGGLVQGYRIVAYDDYRNKVYAIGIKPNASKPFFLSRVAQGVTLADWGVWGKPELHGDIVDKKDLERRARASANRMSRPGKSIALGIRVRSIDYCDGYDVLDSVPIDIVDGAIDTNNFGGGYWTIWGINYRVYDDEHDELTWILRPKGDSSDFDPDLITSEPEAISSEWAWGSGAPTP
jgi:hypothetical protein